jgi:hypothetical protein
VAQKGTRRLRGAVDKSPNVPNTKICRGYFRNGFRSSEKKAVFWIPEMRPAGNLRQQLQNGARPVINATGSGQCSL